MKKPIMNFLAFFFLISLVSPAAFAITWGSPDGTGHPYVGIMYFETPSGIYRGTGALLSSTVFLTAGHCTEESGVVNLNSWVCFNPEIVFPSGLDDDDAFKAYLNNPDNGFIKGNAIPHPNYDDYNEFPDTYDVGVVILNTPVVMGQYAQLPSLGSLGNFTRGLGRKNNIFTAVGYGLQGYVKPFYSEIRSRFQGDVTLIELNSHLNGDQQSAKFTNNPGKAKGTGGTCFGDSGGPVLFSGTNVVAAVVSWGNTPCIGVDYQFRMDTPTAQNFVRSYLP
jgi:hypothetical protein